MAHSLGLDRTSRDRRGRISVGGNGVGMALQSRHGEGISVLVGVFSLQREPTRANESQREPGKTCRGDLDDGMGVP